MIRAHAAGMERPDARSVLRTGFISTLHPSQGAAELQLELLNLNNDLLTLGSEDHAAQLLDDQLQMFDLPGM